MTCNDFTIGGRLAGERRRLGYAQRHISAALDVSHRTVASWESGQSSPNADRLYLLAQMGFDICYVVIGIRGPSVVSEDGSQAFFDAYGYLYALQPIAQPDLRSEEGPRNAVAGFVSAAAQGFAAALREGGR